MDRNSTSILTGTLVLSVLLSSGTKTASRNGSSEAGRPREVSTRSAFQGAATGVSANQHGGGNAGYSSLRGVADEARTQYQESLKQLIEAECQPGYPRGCNMDLDDFIIALAPDPVHTHLALTFDRTMEAIQEALQDEDYTYVRSVMPLETGSHPESDQVSERVASLWYEKTKQEYPGLMAFRGKRQPLFVLVVGESPTGGINRLQFQNAVEQ